eukprot:1213043-Amphidinium_carterae.3
MESIETEHIALLPKNLIWCYDELNYYVKTVRRQVELRQYFERSIRLLCDSPKENEELHELFRIVDTPYGSPGEIQHPAALIRSWQEWAHRKSQMLGFTAEDSLQHLTVETLKFAPQGPPKRPSHRQMPIEPPCGIFPRHWLVDGFPPSSSQASC